LFSVTYCKTRRNQRNREKWEKRVETQRTGQNPKLNFGFTKLGLASLLGLEETGGNGEKKPRKKQEKTSRSGMKHEKREVTGRNRKKQ
jgi:hypothetical protein